MACTWILQDQGFRILSDAPFLAFSLGALLLWRIYEKKSSRWALIACGLVAAYAPLLRFQGLFLCGAFGLALFFKALLSEKRSVFRVTTGAVIGLATLVPFAAWTYRNFVQFTPDTFNMANQYFFGQMGLSMYAPTFAKAEWIGAGWKYGIYNLAYQLRELGVVVFGRSVMDVVPTEVVVLLLGGLIAVGSPQWFKKASRFEQIYIIVSVVFFIKQSLGSSWLRIVQRYWLPLLPFVMVSAGLGLSFLYNKAKRTQFRWALGVFIGFMVLLIVQNGINSFRYLRSKGDYYKSGNEVMAKVRDFMDKRTDAAVPVATTDWGVMPFVLKRTCYPVLNDESHVLSLERMEKYKTGYLVILDGSGVWAEPARKMVQDLPQLFNSMFEVDPGEDLPSASVYEVDLEGVKKVLNASGSQSSEK
jgi:hypothetical protein